MGIGGDCEFSPTIPDIDPELDHADRHVDWYLLDLFQDLCSLHLWGFISTPVGPVALGRRGKGNSSACFPSILTIVGFNNFILNLQFAIFMDLVMVDSVTSWYLSISNLIFQDKSVDIFC